MPILVPVSVRATVIAGFPGIAMFSGSWAFRGRESSSPNATSRISCTEFSIPPRPRTSRTKGSASAARPDTKRRRSTLVLPPSPPGSIPLPRCSYCLLVRMPFKQPSRIPADRIIPVFYPPVLTIMGRYRMKGSMPVRTVFFHVPGPFSLTFVFLFPMILGVWMIVVFRGPIWKA
jgi:hypothetical protein